VTTLRITEIFFSLQGETRTVGLPTVFIRLTGCPLRCQYCDTSYAFYGGARTSLERIIEQVQQYRTSYVTVTGGEPLAQPESLILMAQLCDLGYQVSLETSGALDVSTVDPQVVKVIDVKTPGSKQAQYNIYNNFKYLLPHDQLKFVICDREDYEWSIQIIKEYQLDQQVEILFSPSYGQLEECVLADWILEDQLPVRFQLQMHKQLWGNVPGK
jgi:7-carboxy-7-deazaguanine synthase